MPNSVFTIAVIASGIDEEYQQSILNGMHRYAAQHQVNIAHFIAYGGILSTPNYDQGEYNIFELPDFTQFDGVILLSNTFSADIVQKLHDRIVKAGIPAVSIDRDIDDLYYIGIENGPAMEKIVRHIIEKHGVKRINYISGPDENTESIERFAAFQRVLADYEINLEPDRVYHGTFRAKDGRRAIEAFLRSRQKFPDAIICANDAMAISAVIALEAHGIRCPEDVLVTGFDNIYHAQHFSPRLTTVERPLMQSGALACELILRHISGDIPERVQTLDAQAIFAESCGCQVTAGNDAHAYKKHTYQQIDYIHRDISRNDQMSCSLVECDSFTEYISALQRFVLQSKCEEFYLCLNDNWHTKQISPYSGYNGDITQDSYIVEGYSGRMIMPLAYYNGEFRADESFSSKQMLPRLRIEQEDPGKTRRMYFVPLHFRERCLGYFVIVNSDFPMVSSMFHSWALNISNTLENFRKLLCLDEMVQELDKLYAIDSLTGIYNRNGFKRIAQTVFERCISEKRSVMIMFCDMDGLKSINDTYGHKEGDHAIRSIAAILQECCVKGETPCRFGGDEFFIFGADYTEEDAEILKKRVQDAIDICNRNSGRPYQLGLSMGACITVPPEDCTIFQLITLADKKMYEEKKKRNPSKYLSQTNNK